ncbi:MAG: Ig-like domain-containing protein, partial [Ginsengibacter sp.]
MRPFFVIFFLHLVNYAQAKNYYFSGVTGDDSRTSLQAQNPSTPWKTLTKLNSFFASVNPGDSVLLKRGETFYGLININNKSGTATSPIVIGAFGTGNKPIITGLKTLSTWTSVGNGIYESYNSSLDTSLNMVLLDGDEQQIGRYPNTDAAFGGYLYFETHVDSTSVIDNEFTAATNYWSGAQIVVRQRRWILDRAKILSHTGTRIKHTPISGAPYDNYGYFIQDHIKTLDKFGEWYYNPATKKVSMYFGSNSPTSYLVQAAAIADVVYTNWASYIVFDNLVIKGANMNGFNIYAGSNSSVINCDIQFSGINGVEVWGNHPYFTIEGSTISNSNNNGIELGYSDNAIVRNNKITNTSMFAGLGQSGDGNGIAIHKIDKGTIIEFNEIRNTGYTPIYFSGDSVTIKNNYIDSFCSVKDDGAGIYTYGGTTNVTRYGRKVIGNIVLNGVGAGNGTDDVSKKASQGIYMDGNASGVEILNNTISNVNRGLYLHNSRNTITKDNTLYDNQVQMYLFQQSYLAPMRNNTITNNIVFSKISPEQILYLKSNADDIALFGRLDSNYYTRPLDDKIVISNNFVKSSGASISQSLDIEGWTAQYNKDAASKRSPIPIVPYKLNNLLDVNKVSAALSTGSTTLKLILSSCSAAVSTADLLDGSYIEVTPSARNSSVYTIIGGLTAGKNYILRYSVRGSVDSTMTIGTFFREVPTPYTILTPIQYRKIGTQRSDYEILFTSLTTIPSVTVVFKVDDQNKYYLDNLSVYEADAVVTNPDDSIRFEFNATNVTKSVALNGTYIDSKNNSYAGTIILQPYTSAVLIRSKSAPTVSITSPANNGSFIPFSNITINATAADADGSVTKVDFYNGSTLLGTDNTSPYSFTWNSVASGTHILTAKATNNSSLFTTSSPITISVSSINIAPTITITSPSNNANFTAPANITINATAADQDGSITKVDFYNGNTLLGTDNTSPYSLTWNNVTAGTCLLTAKATDNGSMETASSAVTVTVAANTAPTVSMTFPVNNSSFTSPADIAMKANAADSDGTITKVAFYSGTKLLGVDTTSPYSCTWANIPAGTYTLTAQATDNGGLVTTSAPVTVSATTPIAPTVSVTSPIDSASFAAPASIIINAIANDEDGSVSKVDFYEGNTLLGTDNASPYTFTWNNVAAGTYIITAKAMDNGSLVTTSSPVTISVITPNIAPTVSMTNPVNNTNFIAPANIAMKVTAVDSDGTISKVTFHSGTRLLGIDTTYPYSCTWANVPAGTYTLTAQATDNEGLVTTSAGITV